MRLKRDTKGAADGGGFKKFGGIYLKIQIIY